MCINQINGHHCHFCSICTYNLITLALTKNICRSDGERRKALFRRRHEEPPGRSGGLNLGYHGGGGGQYVDILIQTTIYIKLATKYFLSSVLWIRIIWEDQAPLHDFMKWIRYGFG